MKAIIALFIVLISYGSTYAQDPQLFENTWHLQKLVIDEEEILPPNNSEVNDVILYIGEDYLDTGVCNGLFGTIINADNTSITVDQMSVTLIDCNLQVNAIFGGVYFDFYGWQNPPKTYE